MSRAELLRFLEQLFGTTPLPKPLNLLTVPERLAQGRSTSELAREFSTTKQRVDQVAAAPDTAAEVLGVAWNEVPQERFQRIRRILGFLLLGRAAEVAFEEIYRGAMGGSEFELVDLREGRTDTDYRLLNGGGRPLYRINIKFFGSNFRRGPEMVGLEPTDCFPLATYKIHGALQKQDAEHLPYMFVIVGVPGLTGETVGPTIDAAYVNPLAWISASSRVKKKRDFEDLAIGHMVANSSPAYDSAYRQIRAADWFVLSARRADKLLREKLFDRVFALRVPGFAQQFRSAELDMHFSLRDDTIRLTDFLALLKREGQTQAATMLERGTI